ncbi:nuclear transport factor 2 family protein [Pseudofrankia saprophytica]|uniref:nuclear transport factor 2 family protein n=1 Tax=Pseudofrankia saprophytica TaxID=298655 RepID=UPI0012FEC077|nr:nuclear transport factor 2 family protein [Pseudofrankia saprophytica]
MTARASRPAQADPAGGAAPAGAAPDGAAAGGAAAGAGWSGLPAPAAAYVAAMNTGDPDAIAACVTVDFRNEHASPRGRGCEGRTTYRERLPGFLAAFPGLRYSPDPDQAPVAAGGRVAMPYVMTATLPAGPLRLRGLWLLTLRDGQVSARLDYWDSGSVPP